MKINSFNLGMESTNTYAVTQAYQKKVVGSYAGNGANMPGNFAGLFDRDVNNQLDGQTLKKGEEAVETVDSSASAEKETAGNAASVDEILSMMSSGRPLSRISKAERITESNPLRAMDEFRQQLIRYLEELFNKGKKYRDSLREGTSLAECHTEGTEATDPSQVSLLYEENYSYTEHEAYSFSTSGTVVDSTGREIQFNLDVSMSRTFYTEYGQTFAQAVNFCDPLVINLDSDVAEISDQKFFFDLDSDGIKDEIHAFGPGTGMLALDLNEDGVINDGGELFGTKTGDGFYDLSKYDSDRNGWIDENDEIWNKVKIWVKEADGTDTLYSLADKGVGAIYLGRQATNFHYKDDDNLDTARLRSTGMFLYESGVAGTMQQVDLAG
jgi:hypothetical protein